jgi:hypothetical protein
MHFSVFHGIHCNAIRKASRDDQSPARFSAAVFSYWEAIMRCDENWHRVQLDSKFRMPRSLSLPRIAFIARADDARLCRVNGCIFVSASVFLIRPSRAFSIAQPLKSHLSSFITQQPFKPLQGAGYDEPGFSRVRSPG